MIIFFSGTGNSKYAATMLGDKLNDEIIDAGLIIKSGKDISGECDFYSNKPWVFVCPTYAWNIPRIFESFIKNSHFRGSRDAFFVMTCGDSIGNSSKKNMALCKEKDLSYKGTLRVIMPENYIAMFNVPDKEASARIMDDARLTLEEATDSILDCRSFDFESDRGLTGKILSRPVNKIFYKVIVKSDKFHTGSKCVGCGKCAESCVLNNIKIESGKPVWGDNCTHCMACICGCPKEAIEYGKASIGKRRYICEEYK